MAKKDADLSKVQMVRNAIDELGWKAKLDQYAEFIKKNYGVEMSKAHISQSKTAERKRRGVRGARTKSADAADVAKKAPASISDILSFVDEVKAWEQKIGAAGIREVIKSVLKK